MEISETGKTQGFGEKLHFLKERLLKATDQKPFYIQLINSKLINFDFLEGEVPKVGEVVELIKRDKRRRNPDNVVLQLGPLGKNGVVSYACFPVRSVEIEGEIAVIDCAQVLKEGVFTMLPNFFVEKSQN